MVRDTFGVSVVNPDAVEEIRVVDGCVSVSVFVLVPGMVLSCVPSVEVSPVEVVRVATVVPLVDFAVVPCEVDPKACVEDCPGPVVAEDPV